MQKSQLTGEISEVDSKMQLKVNEAQVATETGEQQRAESEKQLEISEEIKGVEIVSQPLDTQVTSEANSVAIPVSAEAKAGERKVELTVEAEESVASPAAEMMRSSASRPKQEDDIVLSVSNHATKTGEQRGSDTQEKISTFLIETTVWIPNGVVQSEHEAPGVMIATAAKAAEQTTPDTQEIADKTTVVSPEITREMTVSPAALEEKIHNTVSGDHKAKISEQEHAVPEERVDGVSSMTAIHVTGRVHATEMELGANAVGAPAEVGEQLMKNKEEELDGTVPGANEETSKKLASSDLLPDTLAEAETIPFTETPRESGKAIQLEEKQDENTVTKQVEDKMAQLLQEKQSERYDTASGPTEHESEREGETKSDLLVQKEANLTVSETALLEDTTAAVDMEAISENEPNQKIIEVVPIDERLASINEADQHQQMGESRLVSETIEAKSIAEITGVDIKGPTNKDAGRLPHSTDTVEIMLIKSEIQTTEQLSVARYAEEPDVENIQLMQQLDIQESAVASSRTSRTSVTQVTTEVVLQMKPGDPPEISIKSIATTIPERTAQETEVFPNVKLFPIGEQEKERLEKTSVMTESASTSAVTGGKTDTLSDLKATLKQEDVEGEQSEQIYGKETQMMGLTVDAIPVGISISEGFPMTHVAEGSLGPTRPGMLTGLQAMNIQDPKSPELDAQLAQDETHGLIEYSQTAADVIPEGVSRIEGSAIYEADLKVGKNQVKLTTESPANKVLDGLLSIGGEISSEMVIKMAETIAPLRDEVINELLECTRERKNELTGDEEILKAKLDIVETLVETINDMIEEAKEQLLAQVKMEVSQSVRQIKEITEDIGTTQPLSGSPSEWVIEIPEEEKQQSEVASRSAEEMLSLTHESGGQLVGDLKHWYADDKEQVGGVITMEGMTNMTDVEGRTYLTQIQAKLRDETMGQIEEIRDPSETDVSEWKKKPSSLELHTTLISPKDMVRMSQVERLLEDMLKVINEGELPEVVIKAAEKIAQLSDKQRYDLIDGIKRKQGETVFVSLYSEEKLSALLGITERMNSMLEEVRERFILQLRSESSAYAKSVTGGQVKPGSPRDISGNEFSLCGPLPTSGSKAESDAVLEPSELPWQGTRAVSHGKEEMTLGSEQADEQGQRDLSGSLHIVETGRGSTERTQSATKSETARELSPEPDEQNVVLGAGSTGSETSQSMPRDKEKEKLELLAKLLAMTEEEREEYVSRTISRLDEEMRKISSNEIENMWNVIALADRISKMSLEDRKALARETRTLLGKKSLSKEFSIDSRSAFEETERERSVVGIRKASELSTKEVKKVSPVDSERKVETISAFSGHHKDEDAGFVAASQGVPETKRRRKRGRRTTEDSDNLDRQFNAMMGTYRRNRHRPESHRFTTQAMRSFYKAQRITHILDALILDTIQYVKKHLPTSPR